MASAPALSEGSSLSHVYFFANNQVDDISNSLQQTTISKPSSRSESPSAGSSDETSSSTGTSTSSGLNPLANEFTPTPPPTSPKTKLYELRDIPGKGLGLIATQLISAGTRIFCEEPILRIGSDAVQLAWGPYCRLSNAQKKAFDALHFFKPETIDLESASRNYLIDRNDRSLDDEDIEELVQEHIRVMGTFAANNFQCGPGLAVFANTSRLNHSCVPNVHHSYNPTLKKQTVQAVRDIQPGEELCTTYLGGPGSYQIRTQRIAILRSSYGFTCTCSACTDTTGMSDARREVLGHLAYGLQLYLKGGDNPMQVPYVPTDPLQALQQAEHIIDLLSQEGLLSMELCRAYRMAAQQALVLQDFTRAIAHAVHEQTIERNVLGREIEDLHKMGTSAACWIEQIRTAAKAAGRELPGHWGQGFAGKGKGQGFGESVKQKKSGGRGGAAKKARKVKKAREMEEQKRAEGLAEKGARKAEKEEARREARRREGERREYESAWPALKL